MPGTTIAMCTLRPKSIFAIFSFFKYWQEPSISHSDAIKTMAEQKQALTKPEGWQPTPDQLALSMLVRYELPNLIGQGNCAVLCPEMQFRELQRLFFAQVPQPPQIREYVLQLSSFHTE